jgi:hypothetical protein
MLCRRSFGSVVAAIAAAATLSFSVYSANALPVTIGFQQDGVDGGAGVGNIATQTPVADTGTGSISVSGTYGTFTVNLITASGNPDLPPPGILNSNALNTSSTTAGTLVVYVTSQGNTLTPGSWLFSTGFTENLFQTGWSVTQETYFDAGNGLFALTTLLGTATFSGTGLAVDSAAQSVNVGAGPFSVTHVYTIAASGAGQALSTISLAVPGPIVGAGLPGLLIACAALVALARRRRHVAV